MKFAKKVIRHFLQMIRKWKWRKKCIYGKNVIIDRLTEFEKNNKLGNNCVLINTSMGYASYCSEGCFLKNVIIGRFCSIGENVKTINGTHPTQFVSTHPAFYSVRKQCGMTYVDKEKFHDFKFFDNYNGKSFIVGNDVWIGSDVRLMEGCEIGDGAVIAAGAVVVGKVPPYAIVGGVPAKIIRYRFDANTIRWLSKIRWWERDDDWIKEHANLFDSIDKLYECLNYESATRHLK